MAYEDYKDFLFAPNSKQYALDKENWEYVDTIDFLPYLHKLTRLSQDVHDNGATNITWLRRLVEKDLKDAKKPKACDGYVFNRISESELAEYLSNRYLGFVKTYEEPTIYCYLTREGLAEAEFRQANPGKKTISPTTGESRYMSPSEEERYGGLLDGQTEPPPERKRRYNS